MARDPDGPREPDDYGPAHRVREGDHLWYLHPLTGERFLSVTSALEHRAKEDLDHRWRPMLSAKAALTRLPELVRATLTPECGQTNGRCSRKDTRQHEWTTVCVNCPCGQCPTCVTKSLAYEHYRESKRATDRGSAFHYWAEGWVLENGDSEKAWQRFRTRYTIRNDLEMWVGQIRPYTDSFLRWVDDMGLAPDSWLLAEATVLNRTYMWGGTLDGQLQLSYQPTKLALEVCERLGMANPVVNYDTKTREAPNPVFYDDNALQQAAYRRGEVVLLDDGTEEPLRFADGAIVVQVRPDGYGWRIVVTDNDTYEAFLGVLAGARWTIERGNASTLVKSHPRQVLDGVTSVVAPKRAAPRKAAVPKKTMPKRVAEVVPSPIPAEPARSATTDSLRPDRYTALRDKDIPF